MEILVPGEEPLTLHLGDSFGVEPTLKKMRHRGVMKTRVDDCQVSIESLISRQLEVEPPCTRGGVGGGGGGGRGCSC